MSLCVCMCKDDSCFLEKFTPLGYLPYNDFLVSPFFPASNFFVANFMTRQQVTRPGPSSLKDGQV